MVAPMWSVQEAKNQLSAVIDAALTSSPQVISRRGKPSVVVVSLADYERLKSIATANRGSFIDALLAMPPSPNPDDDEDEFPRIPVVPRDVDFE
jgi:prevent-host-death family protein